MTIEFSTVWLLLISGLLVYVGVLDMLRHQISLMSVFVIGLLGFIYQASTQSFSIVDLFIGGMLGGLFFGTQYLVSRGRWIGSGDVFLGVVLGLVFGGRWLWFVIVLAYGGGAFLSLLLLLLKKIHRSDRLPLGSFLSAATLVAMCIPSSWIWFDLPL